MERPHIIEAVVLERYRQDKMHPSNELHDYLPILIEEVGEIGKALQNRDEDNLKEELVQLAALCFRWLEAI